MILHTGQEFQILLNGKDSGKSVSTYAGDILVNVNGSNYYQPHFFTQQDSNQNTLIDIYLSHIKSTIDRLKIKLAATKRNLGLPHDQLLLSSTSAPPVTKPQTEDKSDNNQEFIVYQVQDQKIITREENLHSYGEKEMNKKDFSFTCSCKNNSNLNYSKLNLKNRNAFNYMVPGIKGNSYNKMNHTLIQCTSCKNLYLIEYKWIEVANAIMETFVISIDKVFESS